MCPEESITVVKRRGGILPDLFLFLLLMLISVEGIFVVTPKSTTVILNRPITIECETDQGNFGLFFSFFAPSGQPVVPQSPTIYDPLPNGGTRITITFDVTEELNTTTVICTAAGATNHQTSPATINAYAIQEYAENFKACQLNQYVFIIWNSVLAIEGINITYRITDNKGSNITTSTPYYSFENNVTEEYDYMANVTVIAKATAVNQTSYSNVSYLVYKLNGTVLLNLRYDKDLTSRSGEEWRLFFQIKLNVTECTIDEETLKNATLVSCNDTIAAENCTNSTSVNYIENHQEINSTNHLSPRQRYSSTLCFPYLGREIISQQVHTSTHDIQDIVVIPPNDTSSSLCLRFYLIHHYLVQNLSLYLERNEEIEKFTVPVKSNNFEWCAGTIPASSSKNSGNWSLFACDGQETECTNPAVILNSISLNVVFPTASSTHITHILHTTTTTTSLSSSLSATSLPTISPSVSPSLIPSPSSVTTATESSPQTENNIVIISAFLALFVLLILLSIPIIVYCACHAK